MRRALFFLLLMAGRIAGAQVTTISIPAGSPEEKAFQAAGAENDPQKRIGMLTDIQQQFAANSQAVTLAQWQIAQTYQDQGDLAKALEFGQKAAAAQPNNLDLLVFVAGIAQRAKANDVVMDCAVRGGAAFNGIAKEPKPEGMEQELYDLRVKQAQDPVRPAYEFLEATALNAIVAETNNTKRMTDVEKFIGAFPNTRFQEQIAQLAVATLAEMKDSARLNSFSQKALAANPNSVSTLVVLSEAYAESADAGSAARAEGYARKAVDLSKTQKSPDGGRDQLYDGLAHSALGYALLKQEKSALALPELKTACSLLKEHSDAYAAAMYRLGFAYAKTPGHLADAKATLTELISIDGPYKQPARDLLARVQQAASTKGPARRTK
jgi:tetratricopeptide (TPR) repeat protein